MRVLFISAPIGAGHIKAAQAVCEELRVLEPDGVFQVVNIFDFLPPSWGRFILAFYLKILALFPQAYGLMYGWGNQSSLALWGRKLVSRYLANRLEQYLTDWQPDMVVCSHATPAGLVADLVKRRRIFAPTLAIVTDFVVHRLWIYPEIEQYAVADEKLRDFLLKYEIPTQRIMCSGIPVGAEFSEAVQKEDVLSELGLAKEKQTVLLMGGGAGLLPMEAIILAGVEQLTNVQWIAIAGQNQRLQKKLIEIEALYPERVRAVGYTQQVHRFMAAADVLVSKPGGLTVAESLCRQMPLVIYRPIPGQEEANTTFLIEHGVAVRAETVQDVVGNLMKLLCEDSVPLENMLQRIKQLRRPEAAKQIALLIKERIKSKNNEKC
ncbi:MGDG synthase family glycosyltransferase [Azotosporobacter soli]|uniref:MGDG synthase family glycosyltransferase n=1 Tax=Azotosporobacter soli TaxID=3055040 RepID=UPI0031FEFE3C